MNNLKLTDLIQEFHPDKLIPFINEKNNAVKPSREFLDRFNDEDFSEGIKLGEITFSSHESIIICTFKVNKALSERSGKKAQYEKAKRILDDFQADAGIFVFYDQIGNFRFSLVYTNYLGKKRDWSSFRRFTYFVSPDLTNKTFLDRIGKGDFSNLEAIKESFSVEKVTKDFYQEISYWYFWAVQKCKFPKDAELEENGRNISVIRLITRMIFIWFMRERGLVPKELFSQEFINENLKDHSVDSSSYYQAILQNLFFATLSTKKSERVFRNSFRAKNGFNPDYGNQFVYRFIDYFEQPELIQSIFKDIPFLNGGLFDCLDDKDTGIYIDGFSEIKKYQPYVPNFLFFSDSEKIDINAELGTKNSNYNVRGLLKIFSAFNFTIDENTLDDQEVALDPELLGRVFENLLASFNPETASTARKATGSYYTPREIVEYMVDESLKGYLSTHLQDIEDLDTKLNQLFSTTDENNPFDESQSKKIVHLIESIRIVDPAVGSGAFPMGILNKLVFLLHKVDKDNKFWEQAQLDAVDDIPDFRIREEAKKRITLYFYEKNADYGRKLFLIQKCIYGVDIQQIAVEIAKLRFFVSLLVEEKIDYEQENWGIEPLPNLEFKIMQGNSLVSEFLGVSLDINKEPSSGQIPLEFINEKTISIKEFEHKKIEFQNESDRKNKNRLLIEIEDEMIKIFKNIVKVQKEIYFNTLEDINRKYSSLPKTKITEDLIRREILKVNQRFGFDLDYAEKQLRKYTGKMKTRPFFPWQLYFAEVFSDKDGFDIVIGNPPYIKEYTNRNAFDGVRSSPYYQGKMDIWYMFACQGLDLLRSKTGILSFIATNNWITNSGASKLRNKISNDATLIKLLDFGDYKIFENAGIQTMVMIVQRSRENDSYQFELRRLIGNNCIFDDVIELLQKIENPKSEFLLPGFSRKNMIDKFFVFANQNQEELLQKLDNKRNYLLNNMEVATGIDVHQDFVNQASKITLGKNFNVGDGIFILSNYEKDNLNLNKNELNIINPYYTTNELQKFYGNKTNSYWIIYTDSSFRGPDKIKSYPNIKKHLDKYSKIITSDNKPYGLHRSRNENFFVGEKIISARKCLEPTFTYADFDCYVSQSFYVIKTNKVNLKFLTGLFNSKLVAFWLRNKGKMQGFNYQVDKEPLLSIPIFVPSLEFQNKIVTIVEKIIEIKSNDINASISLIANHLDQIIYEIYELNEDEITLIESQINNSNNEMGEEEVNTSHVGILNNNAINEQKEIINNNQVDYELFRCQECGSMVMSFDLENHEKDRHEGTSVKWKKIG